MSRSWGAGGLFSSAFLVLLQSCALIIFFFFYGFYFVGLRQCRFWLSETLKYLFLLFSDRSVLPLDKWVLNTEVRSCDIPTIHNPQPTIHNPHVVSSLVLPCALARVTLARHKF